MERNGGRRGGGGGGGGGGVCFQPNQHWYFFMESLEARSGVPRGFSRSDTCRYKPPSATSSRTTAVTVLKNLSEYVTLNICSSLSRCSYT